MEDPLSVAASVTGLIIISAHIVGIAKDLFDKVKGAPETMMLVREEVENMQPIFGQIQLLLNGAGSQSNYNNLTMIAVHNLMTTLTGCVIVYSRLEGKLNEVCGFDGPTTASTEWKRAGVIADRVKWGLWRHEEVLGIFEDLQRQNLSLSLMLTITNCTTIEASDAQARLQALSTEIWQSSHPHSVFLRDLISHQEEQVQPNISTFANSAVSTHSSAAGNCPPDNPGNAPIMSKRNTFSLRPKPSYIEDLKASRAYKRLRHFGLGIDSSTESVLSFDSGCSGGNWSMLSDLSLGDLSVSQIAVLNLPIDLADVSNPEPFQQQSSIETHRSRPYSRRKWSSRGRIHNAIEAGNEFVVRTLLNMGMDVEELDSSGRTPLVHAAVKHQEAICKLLLEKGAKVGALKTFTSGMTFTERFELLVPSAVSMHYVVNAGYKTILQLLSLIESRDTEGWTPLASAAFNNNEALCEFLVEKGCSLCLVTEQKYQLKSKLSHRIHVAAQGGHKTALQLLLDIGADINERDSSGETALLQAVFYNHLSCVKILIERRADATISTNEDISVLHHAALRSTNSEMMKFVLGHIGTRARELLNATNQWGNTPLHDCSFGSRIVGLENVKMLLQAGATLTIKNNRGKTPYECARERGSKEIAKYLWSQLSRKQQACEQAPPSDW